MSKVPSTVTDDTDDYILADSPNVDGEGGDYRGGVAPCNPLVCPTQCLYSKLDYNKKKMTYPCFVE